MPEPYVEIIDRFGRRRRARRGEVAGDGETVHFGMQFMDGTARAVRDALAEKFGPYTRDDDMRNDQRPRGYVRGYAFADAPVVARTLEDAATQAYEERSARMSNAWRHKSDAQADEDNAAPPRARTLSLDALRAKAEQAWADRNKRMQNAWRHD
jgi:hypothetical protein